MDAQGRVAKWKLYRIPVRSPTDDHRHADPALDPASAAHRRAPPDRGEPDIVARFALARLRFVGSPWVRRSETPIAGLAGSPGKPHGEVIASIVSTENQTDLGYTSPPGVFETHPEAG